MRVVEKVGRSKEEAITLALEELGISEEKVKVEVIEESSTRSLLGLITTNRVKVRVTEKEEVSQIAVRLLREILVNMGVSAMVEVLRRPDHIILNVRGRDLGCVIGRKGQTLDSLQYLVNLAVNRQTVERERIIIDVEGYRKKQEEILRRMALRSLEKVKRQGTKEMLPPMSPHERRIIHLTLQNEVGVTTYSEGEDPYRRVIIIPQESK